MNIVIGTDAKLAKCGDKYYALSQHYYIFQRYFDHFGKLVIISRCEEVEQITSSHVEVSEIVSKVVKVSSFSRLILGKNNKEIQKFIENCGLVIGRLDSFVGITCFKIAKKMKKPYFAEVMADAWDAMWNHSLKGKIMAPYMYFATKNVIKNSDYALYVTKEFLQKKYPCKNPSVGVSNVKISDLSYEVLESRLQKIENFNLENEIVLTTTAAVNVKYKGQQFVIKAIPKLNKLGIKVKYRLIGGGDKTYLSNLAKKLGVESQVEFVGRKPLDEVFKLLDETDIYVQPSLQEGLPRSVVEAMSRGCPAIGARTAGIPELIAQECVFKRKSVKDIVKNIQNIAKKEKLEEFAKANFQEAKNYEESVLEERRNAFYEKIKSEIAK